MKNAYIQRVLIFAKHIKGNIGFYPVILSILFLVLAFVLLSLEANGSLEPVKEVLKKVVIKDKDTARSILTTVIGSILSLTVFSFSMVMVVLNQASSNFSPRLLPGLLSNRRHQLILGFYIGTIVYSIIILISVQSYEDTENQVGFSVMLAAFFGINCVFLFVYFINSISQSVQVQNIIENEYQDALSILEQTEKRQKKNQQDVPNSEKWETLKSKHSGYYRGLDNSVFKEKLIEEDCIIEIIPYEGNYVFAGDIIVATEKKLSEELKEDILEGLSFSPFRHTGSGYYGGMVKLMEVAVKAMSPGINDPGTAIDVINRINKLIEDRIYLRSKSIDVLEDNGLRVIINEIKMEDLLRHVVTPIRHYSKGDSSVSLKLAESLNYLASIECIQAQEKENIIEELLALKHDVQSTIDNEKDLSPILKVIDQTES